jgi:hypothetical protein
MTSLTKWSNFEASGSEPRQDQPGCDQPDDCEPGPADVSQGHAEGAGDIKDRRRGKLAKDEGCNQRHDAKSADGRRSNPT